MPLYTAAEVQAKIESLDIKISKTEDEQILIPGGAGAGFHKQRGDLAAMYRERARWIKEYERLEVIAAGGGFANKVQFQRPT